MKAGHAGMASLISQFLPNFIMLLDALSKTYLGSLESKDGDQAEHIQNIGKKYILKKSLFSSWVTTRMKSRDSSTFYNLLILYYFLLVFPRGLHFLVRTPK